MGGGGAGGDSQHAGAGGPGHDGVRSWAMSTSIEQGPLPEESVAFQHARATDATVDTWGWMSRAV